MFTLDDLKAAATLVHRHVPPTPQHRWPLLSAALGADVWVKHENHTAIGAFKVRGGLVYMQELQASGERVAGVITATRGNHGQSVARAASAVGLASTIVVPYGNSVEKNAAMRAFGARLIEHGRDFDEAREEAVRLARIENLHYVPSFHPALVKGVATYALELLEAVTDLDTVYVPIGMGSGVCGMIMARDLLGLDLEVVGVVAAGAPTVARSFEAGKPVPTNDAQTFADGLAVRVPNPDALAMIRRGIARIVTVADDEIAAAIRALYEGTHNLAEGAGAAAYAAAAKDAARNRGRRIAVVLSGGNIDRPLAARVLLGETPAP